MNFASCFLALLLTASPENRSAPLLLDFGATWCPPCQATKPEVERLKAEGYNVRVVDVDRSKDLAARYQIESIPAFVIVDPDGRELARREGATTAPELARFYNDTARKWRQRNGGSNDSFEDEDPEEARGVDRDGSALLREKSDAADRFQPWETVVRIKVYNHMSRPRATIGFGSGTIIYSSDEESIILTCAHIFHMEEVREQPRPASFPLKVKVDLFDGRLSSGKTPQVRTAEVDIPAEVIDYNYSGDVGLIRIRPGRKLPYSQVVPPGWTPREKMKLTTLGCSQGHDATAWTTYVTRPSITLGTQNGTYEGTECSFPPIQGRSGGGLFTQDGVLAGVCDFNDGPRGEHGLYAAPKTIHKLLDKHRLQLCYAGPAGDRARQIAASRGRSGGGSAVALNDSTPKIRGQNPEGGDLTIPPPEILGVASPGRGASVAQTMRKPRARSVSQTQGLDAWQGLEERQLAERRPSESEFDDGTASSRTAGLKLSPAAAADLFAAAPDPASASNEPESQPLPAPARSSRDPWQSK